MKAAEEGGREGVRVIIIIIFAWRQVWFVNIYWGAELRAVAHNSTAMSRIQGQDVFARDAEISSQDIEDSRISKSNFQSATTSATLWQQLEQQQRSIWTSPFPR